MACQPCEHVFCSSLLHFNWTNKKSLKRDESEIEKASEGWPYVAPEQWLFSLCLRSVTRFWLDAPRLTHSPFKVNVIPQKAAFFVILSHSFECSFMFRQLIYRIYSSKTYFILFRTSDIEVTHNLRYILRKFNQRRGNTKYSLMEYIKEGLVDWKMATIPDDYTCLTSNFFKCLFF